MRRALLLTLALVTSTASWASAATLDSAGAWSPIYPFIGIWKGTRAGAGGAPSTVSRVYVTASTNHHLEITEKEGRSPGAVWGMVSLDPQQQVLVLRHFAADGSTWDLPLDPVASTTHLLVFATPETEGTRSRIVYERTGPRNFVERIEHSSAGQAFELVSETRFVRKD